MFSFVMLEEIPMLLFCHEHQAIPKFFDVEFIGVGSSADNSFWNIIFRFVSLYQFWFFQESKRNKFKPLSI